VNCLNSVLAYILDELHLAFYLPIIHYPGDAANEVVIVVGEVGNHYDLMIASKQLLV
jgi:hypothetical protein